MNDYLRWKMFVDEGFKRFICLERGVAAMLVVSPFEPGKTEEENVLALRSLYMDGPQDRAVDLICSDDFGIVVFHCSPQKHQRHKQLRQYCEDAVRRFNQPGYIDWNGQKAEFVAADGTRSPLQPWDRTVECLNEWVEKIHPGFKAMGCWERSMSFLQERAWWYKKKHGLLPVRVEIPEPLTERERQFLALALEYASKLGLDAEAVVSRLSFKVAPEEVKKALGE